MNIGPLSTILQRIKQSDHAAIMLIGELDGTVGQ